jgi:hypothetical protein
MVSSPFPDSALHELVPLTLHPRTVLHVEQVSVRHRVLLLLLVLMLVFIQRVSLVRDHLPDLECTSQGEVVVRVAPCMQVELVRAQ